MVNCRTRSPLFKCSAAVQGLKRRHLDGEAKTSWNYKHHFLSSPVKTLIVTNGRLSGFSHRRQPRFCAVCNDNVCLSTALLCLFVCSSTSSLVFTCSIGELIVCRWLPAFSVKFSNMLNICRWCWNSMRLESKMCPFDLFTHEFTANWSLK